MPEEGEKVYSATTKFIQKYLSLYVTVTRGSLNTTTQYTSVFNTTLSQTR